MSTRNILDSLGNVIGTLTLDDSTTESQWSQALAPYAVPVVTDPISGQTLFTYTARAVNSITTSSSTASTVIIPDSTPVAGKYIAMFNGGINTGGASATGEFGIYVDGVILPETKRVISCNLQLLGGLVTISLNSIGVGTYTGSEIELNGSQVIDVKYKSTNGGTIGFNERVLTLIKVK